MGVSIGIGLTLVISIEFFRKEANKTKAAYDNLQRKYDSAILEKTKILQKTELERDSVVRSNYSLALHYEVLIRSIGKIPKPKTFEKLTNKELENLMIEEYRKFKQ